MPRTERVGNEWVTTYDCSTCEDTGFNPGREIKRNGDVYQTVVPCPDCEKGLSIFRGMKAPPDEERARELSKGRNRRIGEHPVPTESSWKQAWAAKRGSGAPYKPRHVAPAGAGEKIDAEAGARALFRGADASAARRQRLVDDRRAEIERTYGPQEEM